MGFHQSIHRYIGGLPSENLAHVAQCRVSSICTRLLCSSAVGFAQPRMNAGNSDTLLPLSHPAQKLHANARPPNMLYLHCGQEPCSMMAHARCIRAAVGWFVLVSIVLFGDTGQCQLWPQRNSTVAMKTRAPPPGLAAYCGHNSSQQWPHNPKRLARPCARWPRPRANSGQYYIYSGQQ